MKIADLAKGQIWMVEHPVRLSKVLAKDTIKVPNKKTKLLDTLQAYHVVSTIPAEPIAGFVTPEQAEANKVIVKGLGKGRLWKETWAEAVVPLTVTPIGKGAYLDKEKPVEIVYVAAEEGRDGRAMQSSGLRGTAVEGTLVPVKSVPPSVFSEDAAEAPKDK